MSAMTGSVAVQPQAARRENWSARQWVEALVGGGCDAHTFVQEVEALVRRDPQSGWTALALLDSQHRRLRLDTATFDALRARLKEAAIGAEQGMQPRRAPGNGPAQGPAGGIEPPVDHVPPPAGDPMPPSGDVTQPVDSDLLESADGADVAMRTRTLEFRVPPTVHVPPPVPPPFDDVPPPTAHVPPPAPGATASSCPKPRAQPGAGALGAGRELAAGAVLRGRYCIRRVLGRGGMGSVFEATDRYRPEESGSDRRVALKVLDTALVRRPQLLAELQREFLHLQSLSHPNIVRVHEFDRDGDTAFYTMEYLAGRPLRAVLSGLHAVPLRRDWALAIIRDVGAALAHAHARGVVHGDLHPGNIFITDAGEVRVLDFGASRRLLAEPWISEQGPGPAVAAPLFASCQVFEGLPAEPRDDLYALACISYLLLTGEQPFGGRDARAARAAALAPKRSPDLGSRQWRALRAGLRFDRERRPRDLAGWLAQLGLDAAAEHLPAPADMAVPQRRRSRVAWVAAVAAVAAAAVSAMLHFNPLLPQQLPAAAAWAGLRAAVDTAGSDLHWAVGRTEAALTRAAETARSAAPPQSAAGMPVPVTAPAGATALAATTDPAAAVRRPTVGPAAPRPVDATGRHRGADRRAAAILRPRVELAASQVEVPAFAAVARVAVRRSGSLNGRLRFTWWTQSGTAQAGRDFVMVDPRDAHISPGQRATQLLIPLVVDPRRRAERTFYVFIDRSDVHAVLGRRMTVVTIPGS